MPSHLRQQIHFDEPVSAESYRSTISSPPQKKQKMSLSQTYFVAASARSKLGKEASRADHDLRLLVGHANLLDSLMVELADAEREQEAWFNQTVRNARKSDEDKHVRWVDTIVEDDESDSDSDDESDYELDEDLPVVPIHRLSSPPAAPTFTYYELDEEDTDEEEYEDFEDDDEHALVRTPSQQAPPELIHDDDSDDESQPPSPPQPHFELAEDEKQAIATTSLFAPKTGFLSQSDESLDHIMSDRTAPLVASY